MCNNELLVGLQRQCAAAAARRSRRIRRWDKVLSQVELECARVQVLLQLRVGLRGRRRGRAKRPDNVLLGVGVGLAAWGKISRGKLEVAREMKRTSIVYTSEG